VAEASPLAGLYPEGVVTHVVGDAEVPWTFSSLEAEHSCLRTGMGLLDFSALGRISVTGSGAMDFLQSQVARDIAYLFPERCLTTLMLDEDANPVDIVVIYKVQGGYVLETTPGQGSATLERLQANAPASVSLTDLRANQTSLGLEGPFCWQLITQVFDPQITGLTFQGVQQSEWEGHEVLVSRLGFTGEYGFKFDLPIDGAQKLWARLAEETTPVGYQALELAMLEVRQPVLRNEVGEDGNVMRCGLNWLVELEKDDYVGHAALTEQKDAGPDRLPVSFVAEGTVAPAAGAVVTAARELAIGTVVHSAYSPFLKKVVGIARVDAEWAAAGLELEAEDGDGGTLDVRTASSPFLVPMSWRVPIL
jgi:glycine cleavage system aminomethyltransferase T